MLPFAIEAVVHDIISSGALIVPKYVFYRKATKGRDFWKTFLDGYISNLEIQDQYKRCSRAM